MDTRYSFGYIVTDVPAGRTLAEAHAERARTCAHRHTGFAWKEKRVPFLMRVFRRGTNS